jgi:hypothetical protein
MALRLKCMRRRALVRTLVLNSIADDYENLEQITKQVASISADCGMTIPPSEILEALGDLVGAGLAKAYQLSSNEPEEICGMPSANEIGSPFLTTENDIYFWVTKKGMDLQLSPCKDWPFDENNLLRTDWSPPED